MDRWKSQRTLGKPCDASECKVYLPGANRSQAILMIEQKSPKRAIVQELFVQNEQIVAAGDAILQLNSEEQQIEVLKIQSQKTTIAAQRLNMIDPARADRLSAMDQMISSSAAALKSISEEVFAQKEQIKVGEATRAEAIEYKKRLIDARLKNLKIRIERDGFDVNSSAAAKHLDIVLQLLDKEELYFQQEIERLKMRAPVAGKVQLFVGEGSPCKLGSVLFSIE